MNSTPNFVAPRTGFSPTPNSASGFVAPRAGVSPTPNSASGFVAPRAGVSPTPNSASGFVDAYKASGVSTPKWLPSRSPATERESSPNYKKIILPQTPIKAPPRSNYTVTTSLIPHGRPISGRTLPRGPEHMTFLVINDTYRLGKKIGYGSFGEVYQGYDINTRHPVAIKIEHVSSEHQILRHEYQVYQELKAHSNSSPADDALAQIYHFGVEDDYNVLVMDALGASLSDLLKQQKQIDAPTRERQTETFPALERQTFPTRERPTSVARFSLKTTMMLADQMLSRLEFMHDRDFIHRDLKPENFLIGLGVLSDRIYLIDYGLAKRYRLNDKHISFKTGHKLVGTARYASTNSHLGIRLSRRDDLESLGYILIYFLKGSLPWQNLKTGTKEQKYEGILKIKASITLDQLCHDLPNEIKLFMEHVKSLEFIERPNYKYLRSLFRQLMTRHNIQYDLVFDWT